MSEVSVVIVNMNNPELLSQCLDSLYTFNKCNLEVYVVAYMYSQQNLEFARKEFPQVHFIPSDEIRGFAENNNLALNKIESEFLFIVNDDTIQHMPVIDSLLEDFHKLPATVAAVSPKIVFPDGRIQTCGRAPWTAWRWMKHYLHFEDETKPGPWTMKPGLFRTWTLNGACFLARTETFRKAGWFDETYTFTPEDIALGHRFNEMGYEVWADADISIEHLANATASAMETAIKPTRIRGSLLFYAKGMPLKYFCLGLYACAIESARYLKYAVTGCRCERDRIMKDTARNVLRTVFSSKSTKEIFVQLYNEAHQS